MGGTVFELRRGDKVIPLTTIGGVTIDHIGNKGLLSISFQDHRDMVAYLEADIKLEREFIVTLVEMGDDLQFNPLEFVVSLPWIMEKLIAAGG